MSKTIRTYAIPEGKSHWDADDDYPAEDWRQEVQNGDTRLGYWEWVENSREMDELDREQEERCNTE